MITGEITGITHEGKGVCRLEDYVLFVANTAVGDLCEIRVTKTLKAYGFGRVERILRPSPHRVESRCPVGAVCGGCDFWHMTYEAECAAKEAAAAQTLHKALGTVEMRPLLRAKETEGYRNKVQIPFGSKDGKVYSGFYREHSHQVVPVEGCALCSDIANRAAAVVQNFAEKAQVAIYDERAHKGLLRSLFVRTGTGGALVALVCNGKTFPNGEALAAQLRKEIPELRGLLLNQNTERTNVVLGSEYTTLWGVDFLEDTLLGKTYRISPASFYQVNKAQCEVLYQEALGLAALTGTERVLDLYCGIGTIGLSMAEHCREVVGVEVVPTAVENAKANAFRNGVTNAKFLCCPAESLRREDILGDFDVVMLDPPRKGCDPRTLDLVVEIAPKKIVYVSCNPATLGRDLAYLRERGYALGPITPVDMFPRTCHVECVVKLCRVEK